MRKSLLEAHPELAAEWMERNLPLTPADVTYGSNKKVWWRGACGHMWQGTVKNRANGHGCPYCSGNAVLPGYNDLASVHPELAAEWSEWNLPLTPEKVTKRSVRKVWWKGACGHEWQARIADRVGGHGCPYCRDGKLLTGFNDLEHCYPEIAVEWSERNLPLTAAQVKPKSRRNVWWRCKDCGYEWLAVIDTRVKGQQCPACAQQERSAQNAWKYDKPFLTRLPLEMVAYYAASSGLGVLRDDDRLIGLPFSIYLPAQKTAVEMSRTKEPRMEDLVKNELCWRSRIRLIRIVEAGAVIYDNCKCIKRYDTSVASLNAAIEAVLRLITLGVDVDVERDATEAYQRYRLRQSARN